MNESTDPILQAISARFFCLEELIKRGDSDGAISIIRQCKKILPIPTETNLVAAMREAGPFNG